jgi:hypothetical protein
VERGVLVGEEPYSLAALFHHHADRLGAASVAERRVHVLGSDIDARSLDAAASGAFEESDFSETPPELRRRYFAPTSPFTIVPEVRRMVRFERRDLLAEQAPPGQHHLICCRNVLIYFDRRRRSASSRSSARRSRRRDFWCSARSRHCSAPPAIDSRPWTAASASSGPCDQPPRRRSRQGRRLRGPSRR